MKLPVKNIIVCLGAILFLPGTCLLQAQQSNTFYLMHDVPQSNLLNPAVQIHCKTYVGIPALAAAHVSYSNTAFTYNDLAGSDAWNLEGVFDQMHRTDLYAVEAMWVPVALGYRRKSLYFTFNIAERVHGFQTVPRDLAELAVHGNGPFIGETARYNGFRPGAYHIREYSLGVSKKMGPYLTAGIRAKLLFGKANLSTGRSQMDLTTNDNNFGLVLETDYRLNTSFPYTLTLDADGNISGFELGEIDPVHYLLNRKNPGFSVDLGIIYRYSEKITLSASLLDLGIVRWRSTLNNIHGVGEYSYTGADLTAELISGAFIDEAIDSVMSSLEVSTTQDPYSYMLPTQLFLAGSYRYNEKISFGLVNRNVIYRAKVHSSFTLSAQADLTDRFLGTLSWSYLNNSIFNVGLGMAYHGKGFQVHAVTDNLIGFFYPFDTRTLNLRFGVNLMLGCPRNKKERLEEAAYSNLPKGGECPYPENPERTRKKRIRDVRKIQRQFRFN
ncbi:MAG: DUF5723 family protein [Bacteroidota bacterium]